ncbi:DUF4268 domain-containing protein [Maritimibacter sp. 55A14]|uniref:DUF4268 domain-containing protein n=1 Tax=Maritimibacter sp. 55A14 TaxID=2174844 RepID=UPI000D61569F|nr:DUF4268 domain-containing protein [Maritimibacter sp. 55A14]PWE28424.1 DUF4268 domain-containing protein [Maritimibacter sp. 55A14]
MSHVSLDHLKRLSARDAWSNEATDFTPWLAREENFTVLAEALHFIDAEVEGTEHSVGNFSADIIARDRDGFILVENQLEQTDHTHLGQILTYLAGLDGSVKVVWVSTKVREEHRAAVDWLNAHTPDDFSFFAVELELFQIGSSPAAPHFHVVAKPNEWSRHVTQRARRLSETAMSDRQQRYMEFWGAFGDFLAEKDPSYSRRTPSKDYWWSFGIGRSGYSLNLSAGGRDHWISASIVCSNDGEKIVFDHFLSQRSEIEKEMGEELTWRRLEEYIAWDINLTWKGADPMDTERWPEYFRWYWEKMQKLRAAFSQRIRSLDIDQLREASASNDVGNPT